MTTPSNPTNILLAANHINKLKQLLAWDLAGSVAPDALVQLQMQTPRSVAPVYLWLTAVDLDSCMNELIQAELTELETLGVDTDPILLEFRNLVLQVTDAQRQHNEIPLDKG